MTWSVWQQATVEETATPTGVGSLPPGGIAEVTITPVSFVSGTLSPFTGQQQVQVHDINKHDGPDRGSDTKHKKDIQNIRTDQGA